MNLRLKRVAGILLSFAIVLGSGIFLVTTIQNHQSADKSTTPEPYDPQKQATALRRHNELKAAAANSKPKVLFIGDSLTERWKSDGLEPWKRQMLPLAPFNAGIDNDRTENLLWRIRDGALDFAQSPDVCVLLIGINNLAADGDTPYGVSRGVEKVAHELLKSFPETRLIILGLLPSGPAFKYAVGKARKNQPKAPEPATAAYTTYLDVSDTFLNMEGGVKSELTTDGLHLSEKGYRALGEALGRQLELVTK